MSAGLGEYFEGTSAPTEQDTARLLSSAQPMPMEGTPDGLGESPQPVARPRPPPSAEFQEQAAKVIPIVRDVRRLRSVRGLGQNETPSLGVIGIVALGIAIRATGGYFAGKAMAPRGKEPGYAWTGAVVGTIFGVLGLGVQGFVALQDGGR